MRAYDTCTGKNRSKRLLTPLESQSDKKSKTSAENLSTIDDLPDPLLVEILCRLPHNKFVFQCKRVCKRWCTLISDEKFHGRFLWLQIHNQKPAPPESTIILNDFGNRREFSILLELELPMFKTHNFSLRYVPCFEPPEFIETEEDADNLPIVVGNCSDIVLCCDTVSFQRNYYVCNPCTKQYIRIPPTPRCYNVVRVGFICDPYYGENVHEQRREESSTGGGIVQVNVDLRYAIVRIVYKQPDSLEFKVEIFSSETGKWTESTILSTWDFYLHNLNSSGGIAYNGMLYWLNVRAGFLVGLDPFDNAECRRYFRFIDAAYRGSHGMHMRRYDIMLSAYCQGQRLRICHFHDEIIGMDYYHYMNVIELIDDNQGGFEWWDLTGDIDLDTMVRI